MPEEKKVYLFVYGTLRRELVKELAPAPVAGILCGLPYVGNGVIRGELYDLGSYPAAIAGSDFSTLVKGEVYLLTEPEATLMQLDVYEGCVQGEPEASLFVRRNELVRLETGEALSCWIYVYNDWVQGSAPIEGGDYVSYLASRHATLE